MDFKERMAEARKNGRWKRGKRGSYKEKVKGFCIECFGGGRGGRTDIVVIQHEIRDCTDLECPLFEVRPYQKLAHQTSQSTIETGKKQEIA